MIKGDYKVMGGGSGYLEEVLSSQRRREGRSRVGKVLREERGGDTGT